MRILQVLGLLQLGLLFLLGSAGVGGVAAPIPTPRPPPVRQASPAQDGQRWFRAIKPYCNPVEAGVRIQQRPPPQDRDGWGYAAACYALAGKIERADAILSGIESAQDRSHAASIVFQVGHPVADAGDDDAAGPIMRLVVKYQPRNYMALYHAGISEYNMGDTALAREHLRRFLDLYSPEDGWRRNGLQVLAKIEAAEGVDSGRGSAE